MTLSEHAAAVRRFWATIGTKRVVPKLSAEGEALLAAIERVPDGVLVSREALLKLQAVADDMTHGACARCAELPPPCDCGIREVGDRIDALLDER